MPACLNQESSTPVRNRTSVVFHGSTTKSASGGASNLLDRGGRGEMGLSKRSCAGRGVIRAVFPSPLRPPRRRNPLPNRPPNPVPHHIPL